jgi:hypothetical protein
VTATDLPGRCLDPQRRHLLPSVTSWRSGGTGMEIR